MPTFLLLLCFVKPIQQYLCFSEDTIPQRNSAFSTKAMKIIVCKPWKLFKDIEMNTPKMAPKTWKDLSIKLERENETNDLSSEFKDTKPFMSLNTFENKDGHILQAVESLWDSHRVFYIEVLTWILRKHIRQPKKKLLPIMSLNDSETEWGVIFGWLLM